MVVETKPKEKGIDYRLKQLAKLNGGKLNITCSKCHHCR